jgi:hypothetical protein
MKLQIPQNGFPVNLLQPGADAGGRSSAFVSLKNVVKAWIVCYIDQGNAATIALTPNQATTVAGAGAKVITACRIWTNLDAATLDVPFTRQTDAANYTTDAAVKVKFVVFEIDPTQCMDVAGDFDCVRITTGASNAANITSAFLFVEPRFEGASPQSVIVD